MALRSEERFRWAEKQRERNALYWLGEWCRDGVGCEEDAERAQEIFLVAAELGHLDTMICFSALLDKNDPQRFVWLGKAAVGGYSSEFMTRMVGQIREFSSATGHAAVVFVIGRALKGHIDNEKRTIFGEYYVFDSYIGPAIKLFFFTNFNCNRIEKQSVLGQLLD
jgi:hypothetical protein